MSVRGNVVKGGMCLGKLAMSRMGGGKGSGCGCVCVDGQAKRERYGNGGEEKANQERDGRWTARAPTHT